MENYFRPPDPLVLDGNISENWKRFNQKFKLFTKATGLDEKDEEKQVACFLSLLGDEGLDLFNSFTFQPGKDKILSEIVKKFEDHCAPQKNVIFERAKFNTIVQKEGQSFDSFLTELRKAVKTTEYPNQDEMVRDRIVIGIRNTSDKEKLMREASLTLTKAINHCRTAETSKDQVKTLDNESRIDAIRASTSKSVKKKDSNKSCSKCGYQHKFENKCPATGKTCAKCQGRDHFAKVCHNKSKDVKKKVHSLSQGEEKEDRAESDDATGSDYEFFVSSVDKIDQRKRSSQETMWTTEIQVNGKPVTFKLDTGAEEKIAKSVEEKITEIKAKNQEDGSPSKSKSEGKVEKSSRENSNLSDSEELSESSLSRTCGIVSTTEGAEMASDEDSLSLKNETPTNLKSSPSTPTVRQRFRLLKSSKNGVSTFKEGTVSLSNLTKMYNVNVDDVKQMLPDHTEEVESGVDALADVDLKEGPNKGTKMVHSRSLVLSSLEKSIDNIEIDEDGTVNIQEVAGMHWREEDENGEVKTVFAPTGFVDFRYRIHKENSNFLLFLLVLTISIIYLLIQRYSVYTAGMIAGIAITCLSYYIMNKISPTKNEKRISEKTPKDIWEVPAVKEYQPMLKYEGWLNEYPDHYDPSTYHISLTQPVYLKLEGNWLRISNTTSKVPKRAMWNEKEIKKNFKHRRIYNLMGAKVYLVPVGLAKIRHWSKKYPICISISKDQFEFEDDLASKDTDDEKDSPPLPKKVSTFGFKKRTSTISSPQRFSKLFAEQDNFYTDLDSRSDTSSPIHEEEKLITEEVEKNIELEEENDNQSNLDDSWSNCTLDESPTETKIYLFGRTDREKEDWFRRLCMATHHQSSNISIENGEEMKKAASVESILKESEYSLYMSSILKAFKKRDENMSIFSNNMIDVENVSWVNAFLGRILFDCMCDEVFTSKLKERIQRKLAAIKLPYFIEELSITELNMGKTVPLFKKIGKPVIDDRGLWVDMNMIYEGLAVLTLTTKLNLMKLKQPPTGAEREIQGKSAIYNSDVDDSAESSSDDDSIIFPNVPDPTGTSSGPVAPVNKSKKLMKMVDKITESKFFQAATDMKYIKRAMEGVSNTELRLKVEVRALEGTLVLNIPPPPSDRVWIGFRPLPELSLSAHPIVGERNISLLHVTSLIEKKLIQEFQKLLVIPNMEDVIIPVMMSKLPN